MKWLKNYHSLASCLGVALFSLTIENGVSECAIPLSYEVSGHRMHVLLFVEVG